MLRQDECDGCAIDPYTSRIRPTIILDATWEYSVRIILANLISRVLYAIVLKSSYISSKMEGCLLLTMSGNNYTQYTVRMFHNFVGKAN